MYTAGRRSAKMDGGWRAENLLIDALSGCIVCGLSLCVVRLKDGRDVWDLCAE